MKSKKNIYILLPVVLLIWGLLIYKFLSFTIPEIPVAEETDQFSTQPLAVREKDSFKIDVNYRDPFLGKMYMPATAQKKVRKKISVPVEPVVWPNVIYKGIVSDNKDKKKIFMLIINGQTFLMREKETEQGVTVKSGNRESVVIIYKGDPTTIFIQE